MTSAQKGGKGDKKYPKLAGEQYLHFAARGGGGQKYVTRETERN